MFGVSGSDLVNTHGVAVATILDLAYLHAPVKKPTGLPDRLLQCFHTAQANHQSRLVMDVPHGLELLTDVPASSQASETTQMECLTFDATRT